MRLIQGWRSWWGGGWWWRGLCWRFQEGKEPRPTKAQHSAAFCAARALRKEPMRRLKPINCGLSIWKPKWKKMPKLRRVFVFRVGTNPTGVWWTKHVARVYSKCNGTHYVFTHDYSLNYSTCNFSMQYVLDRYIFSLDLNHQPNSWDPPVGKMSCLSQKDSYSPWNEHPIVRINLIYIPSGKVT